MWKVINHIQSNIVENFWDKKQRNNSEILKSIKTLQKELKDIQNKHKDKNWNNLTEKLEKQLIEQKKWTIAVLKDLNDDFLKDKKNIAVNNISKYYHNLFKPWEWVNYLETVKLDEPIEYDDYNIQSYIKTLRGWNPYQFVNLVILDWTIYEIDLETQELKESKDFKLDKMSLKYIWPKNNNDDNNNSDIQEEELTNLGKNDNPETEYNNFISWITKGNKFNSFADLIDWLRNIEIEWWTDKKEKIYFNNLNQLWRILWYKIKNKKIFEKIYTDAINTLDEKEQKILFTSILKAFKELSKVMNKKYLPLFKKFEDYLKNKTEFFIED